MCYPLSDIFYYDFKGKQTVAKVKINEDACKGCGLCVTACPKGIVLLSKTHINNRGYYPVEITEIEKCTGCANCAKMCPDFVLIVER